MSYYETPDQPGQPGDPYQPSSAGGVPATRPPSMDRAVLLMKVGAALAVLGALLGLLTLGQVEDILREANATATDPLSGGDLDAAVTVARTIAIATLIVVGVIGAGLWLWMASANGKGRSWARVVATVFYGINVLFFLLGLVGGQQPIVSLVFGIVQVALGGYVIFLLYQKESSAFYQAASAPQP